MLQDPCRRTQLYLGWKSSPGFPISRRPRQTILGYQVIEATKATRALYPKTQSAYIRNFSADATAEIGVNSSDNGVAWAFFDQTLINQNRTAPICPS